MVEKLPLNKKIPHGLRRKKKQDGHGLEPLGAGRKIFGAEVLRGALTSIFWMMSFYHVLPGCV